MTRKTDFHMPGTNAAPPPQHLPLRSVESADVGVMWEGWYTPPLCLGAPCSVFGQWESLPLSLWHCHRFRVFLHFWHYKMFQAYLVLPPRSPEVSHSSKEPWLSLVANSIGDQDLPASVHIATWSLDLSTNPFKLLLFWVFGRMIV